LCGVKRAQWLINTVIDAATIDGIKNTTKVVLTISSHMGPNAFTAFSFFDLMRRAYFYRALSISYKWQFKMVINSCGSLYVQP